MWFFITMFVCSLLIPLIMIIGGYLMWKRPPRNINSLMGYRTTMSKKNVDTWKFAHDYCGRLWLKFGLIILVPSIVVQIPFVHADDDTIGLMTLVLMMVQLVVVVASIFPVEKALKQTFDKDGVRL
ncbi:MAG: SdpI family protein [Saccharofermentans sp.]|nr:SdpI family protein [Saccharofermentans sp.]